MSKNRKIKDTSVGGAERGREVIGVLGVGLVLAVVIATPLRMRDVLGGIAAGASAIGEVSHRAIAAFAKFWLDVLRAILPEREEVEDVDEEDVLQVAESEVDMEPVIIE